MTFMENSRDFRDFRTISLWYFRREIVGFKTVCDGGREGTKWLNEEEERKREMSHFSNHFPLKKGKYHIPLSTLFKKQTLMKVSKGF